MKYLFLLLVALAGCSETGSHETRVARLEVEARQSAAKQQAEWDRRHPERLIHGYTVRYHEFSGRPAAPFAVFFSDGTFDRGSPRERHFARHLCALLEEKGWTFTNAAAAAYCVAMDYGLVREENQTSVETTVGVNTDVSTFSGWQYRLGGGRVLASTQTTLRTKIKNTKSYAWRLDVTVHAANRYEEGKPLPFVFQGSASAVFTHVPATDDLVAGLFNALFDDFPGKSGVGHDLVIRLGTLRSDEKFQFR